MINLSVVAELPHADGQTDTENLRVVFRNFANALNNRSSAIRVETVFSVK